MSYVRTAPVAVTAFSLILHFACGSASAQPINKVVPPQGQITVAFRMSRSPLLCDVVPCPPPPLGGKEVQGIDPGISVFILFSGTQLRHKMDSLLFQPGDWLLELREPNAGPKSPFPLLLTEFFEEHIEAGNGLIGDDKAEGINLFFPISPDIFATYQEIDLSVSIRNNIQGQRAGAFLISELTRHRLPPVRFCPEGGDARLDVIVQAAPKGPLGFSTTPYDGAITEVAALVPPGEVGRTSFYVALVSRLPEPGPGIQGWGLIAGLSGDVEISRVTTDGTLAALAAFHAANAGELYDPSTGTSHGPGFLTGSVLDLRGGGSLPPVGTTTVLRVDVETKEAVPAGGVVRGRLEWTDGLRLRWDDERCPDFECRPAASRNHVSIRARTHYFCTCPAIDIVFRSARVHNTVVVPGQPLVVPQLDLVTVEPLCSLIPCTAPPFPGQEDPDPEHGLSLFLPFDRMQRTHPLGVPFFLPGDWRLELEDPQAPQGPVNPCELTDFREEHQEVGNTGVIGDQPGEGINLFFPIDPARWALLSKGRRRLTILNLTGGTPRVDGYLVGAIGAGSLPTPILCPTADGDPRLDVIVQRAPRGPGGISPLAYDGAANEIVVDARPGEISTATFYVALVSRLPAGGPGIQGWQLLGEVTGPLEVEEVTVEGTAAEDAEWWRAYPASLVDAETGAVRGHGFLSLAAPYLSTGDSFPPRGTATVLKVTVRTRLPVVGDVMGRLEWRDDLQAVSTANPDIRSAGELRNMATINFRSHRFCELRPVGIRFRSPYQLFRRADANGDGIPDLSDAVGTLDWLFRGKNPPRCLDAADSNDDGAIDLSDAVMSLNYLFRGGPKPPAPGPNGCGSDPTEDQLGSCLYEGCIN